MSKRKSIIELHRTGTPVQQTMKQMKVLKSTTCATDGRYKKSETAEVFFFLAVGVPSQLATRKNIDGVLES